MNFENSLKRSDLSAVLSFLRYGCEDFTTTSELTYAERMNDAEDAIKKYLKAICSDDREYEKVKDNVMNFASAYADIYFEMGAILGGKFAFQLQKKMAALE